MNSTQQFHCGPADWLLYGQLASHVDAFLHYLSERRYSPHTIDANPIPRSRVIARLTH